MLFVWVWMPLGLDSACIGVIAWTPTGRSSEHMSQPSVRSWVCLGTCRRANSVRSVNVQWMHMGHGVPSSCTESGGLVHGVQTKRTLGEHMCHERVPAVFVILTPSASRSEERARTVQARSGRHQGKPVLAQAFHMSPPAKATNVHKALYRGRCSHHETLPMTMSYARVHTARHACMVEDLGHGRVLCVRAPCTAHMHERMGEWITGHSPRDVQQEPR